jgi:hypothetical protein
VTNIRKSQSHSFVKLCIIVKTMLRNRVIAVTIGRHERESMNKGINKGYCFAHDIEYRLENTDDVCPKCLKELNQSLTWRDSMDRVRS